MDIYTKETINLMVENEFDRYIKLMADSNMPTKNKITLIYLKVKDFEKAVTETILKEATKRKELLND